jgi:hypothetical protein
VNSARLLLWLAVRPFRPFRIVMSDSGVIDVFHPDQLIPSKTTAVVGQRASASRVSNRDITISLLHIVRLEPLDMPS